MNNRRKLVIALGAVGICGALTAEAQQTHSMPVVGVLSLESEDRTEFLREGLRRLGYVEGRNIRLETRDAGDRYARFAEITNEFVRLKVDVIVTMGTTATVAARKVTSTIPIVMSAAVDPVEQKLAASLSRPGGNVTGVSTMLAEIAPKRLELTKEAVPGLRRVGVLWNPDSRTSTNQLPRMQAAAKALGLQLQVVEARSANDFDKAFEMLSGARVKIFILLTNSMFSANQKRLLESAGKHGLAGVFSAPAWGESSSALFAYGTNSEEIYSHLAVYVDKILKGARPGDLPIEQPTKFDLVINLRTAKALGIKVPNSILVRADRVIE